MGLSLNQAAKEGRIAKTTLQRALKDGEISATKDDRGRWQIDPSEFGRWLGARSTEQDNTSPQNHNGTSEKPLETSVLEREVQLLREMMGKQDETITDLRQRLDDERSERVRLTALLTDQRSQPQKSPRRGLFGFLRSDTPEKA